MATEHTGSAGTDGGFDEAARTVRKAVDDTAAAGRSAGAAAIDDMAGTARSIADGMEDRQPDLARYARRAAETAEDVSEAIRTRSVGDLLAEVNGFARREPVAFFGVAMLAGFALTRFLGSSAEARLGSEPAGGEVGGRNPSSGPGFDTGARETAAGRPTTDAGGPGAADGLRRDDGARPMPAVPAGSELARHMDGGAGLARSGDETLTPRPATQPVRTDPPGVATRAASAGTAAGPRPQPSDLKH